MTFNLLNNLIFLRNEKNSIKNRVGKQECHFIIISELEKYN